MCVCFFVLSPSSSIPFLRRLANALCLAALPLYIATATAARGRDAAALRPRRSFLSLQDNPHRVSAGQHRDDFAPHPCGGRHGSLGDVL
jgi:hypothetical protein